jgi:hypothetical protein
MYDFTKLLIDILPKIKNFKGFKIKIKLIFSFKLKELNKNTKNLKNNFIYLIIYLHLILT